MSKEKFFAVTIGPIFKTINLAESTGALWATSYMFSYLSKAICEYLLNKQDFDIIEEDIIVPYYPKDIAGDAADADAIVSDGVGRFPDHIIFRAKKFELKDFGSLRKAVIQSVSDTFQIDFDYLMQYLFIACVAFNIDTEKNENPILASSLALDSLELMQPIIRFENTNRIVAAVTNRQIRDLPLTNNFSNWSLLSENGNIRDIESIADTSNNDPVRKTLKKYDYYAVVRSDADNVSKIISMLDVNELRCFSRDCVSYCSKIAELVRSFNGATIYAGGDDLLALMPAESSSGKTVFHFAKEAKECFNKAFETYIDKIKKRNSERSEDGDKIPVPSLSLGINICYSKFPLYQALSDSAALLFDYAKIKCGKDCVVARLQKHSGQSECLVFKGEDSLADFIKFLEERPQSFDEGLLHSVVYAFCSFAPFFTSFNAITAVDPNSVRELFRNMFDSSIHVDSIYSNYLYEILPNFYYRLLEKADIQVFTEAEGVLSKRSGQDANAVRAMEFVLRIAKFYIEKRGDRD